MVIQSKSVTHSCSIEPFDYEKMLPTRLLVWRLAYLTYFHNSAPALVSKSNSILVNSQRGWEVVWRQKRFYFLYSPYNQALYSTGDLALWHGEGGRGNWRVRKASLVPTVALFWELGQPRKALRVAFAVRLRRARVFRRFGHLALGFGCREQGWSMWSYYYKYKYYPEVLQASIKQKYYQAKILQSWLHSSIEQVFYIHQSTKAIWNKYRPSW